MLFKRAFRTTVRIVYIGITSGRGKLIGEIENYLNVWCDEIF